MPPTVRQIIEDARIQHWSFTDLELGDGAALRFLNQRQRTYLAELGDALDGLLGETIQYTIEELATGVRVALGPDGVPFYITTSADAYPVRLDGNGDPYIDTSEPATAGDPFGETGGTPGFPLPTDLVRLIGVWGLYGDQQQNIPIDIIPERERHARIPGRNPVAFVSGARLVPMLPVIGSSTTNDSDRWASVSAVQISYIALPDLTALTDQVILPSVCCDALTADLAELFSLQSRLCPPTDKVSFARKAAQAYATMVEAAANMLPGLYQTSVLYRP